MKADRPKQHRQCYNGHHTACDSRLLGGLTVIMVDCKAGDQGSIPDSGQVPKWHSELSVSLKIRTAIQLHGLRTE